MNYPRAVRIVEVGPRDGLQNEKNTVPLAAKIELIGDLANTGLRSIEVGSFVSPKWVPQMADTAELLARLPHIAGVTYSVLVPNMQGLEAALRSNVQEIAVFAAASETFSQKNTNCSIAQSLQRFEPVAAKALREGIRVRGYLSCVLGCPYEGPVPVASVIHVAAALANMGCFEVSLGDTIGVGTPLKAQGLIRAVSEVVPVEKLAVHFHDTWGQALANVLACLQLGVAVIDSSVSGLGGCPYAKGATGNVATEDVIYLLEGMGISTGVELPALAAAGWKISKALGRKPTSKVAIAMAAANPAGASL